MFYWAVPPFNDVFAEFYSICAEGNLSWTSFQYAYAHDLKKRSLLTERLPRFVTLTHTLCWSLKCEFTLMATIKTQFCRSPYLFLQFFSMTLRIVWKQGLKSIKRAHFEECTEYGKVTVSICLRSTTEMFREDCLLTCYVASTAQTPKAIMIP